MGLGRPKLAIRRPKTKNIRVGPDVILTQGSQVTPPLKTEPPETSNFMKQVLGSVGYSALYTLTTATAGTSTIAAATSSPSRASAMPTRRISRLRNATRVSTTTYHSTAEEAIHLDD